MAILIASKPKGQRRSTGCWVWRRRTRWAKDEWDRFRRSPNREVVEDQVKVNRPLTMVNNIVDENKLDADEQAMRTEFNTVHVN